MQKCSWIELTCSCSKDEQTMGEATEALVLVMCIRDKLRNDYGGPANTKKVHFKRPLL